LRGILVDVQNRLATIEIAPGRSKPFMDRVLRRAPSFPRRPGSERTGAGDTIEACTPADVCCNALLRGGRRRGSPLYFTRHRQRPGGV